MKKILFVAKVDSHITHFQSKYFEGIANKGYVIDVMSEGNETFLKVRNKYNIKFGNNPFSKKNIQNYKLISKIIKEEKYDIIQCNTAVASSMVRMVKMIEKIDSRIVYMAHGFHFYRKGPLKDWLLYYPIEKIFGFFTDRIILINKEDYQLSKKRNIGKEQRLLPGVGVDMVRFNNKKSQGIFLKETIVFSYIAEINKNKNHIELIKAMDLLNKQGVKFICNFIGDGILMEKNKAIVKEMGLEKQIFFKGYKKDVEEELKETDIYLSSSLREGFGINLVEALACGIPVICSRNRGHEEILIEGYNGFYALDYKQFADKINKLISSDKLYMEIANNTRNSVKKFSQDKVERDYIESITG